MTRPPLLIALFLAAALGLLEAFTRFAAEPLLRMVYENRAPGPLNRLLSEQGRTLHPVEKYLSYVRELQMEAAITLTAIAAILLILSLPPVRLAIDRLTPAPPEGYRLPARSIRRFAYAVIALFIGLQSFAVAMRREVWPFSHFAMYAEPQSPTIVWYRAVGDTGNGEIDLRDKKYVYPFNDVTLAYALELIVADGHDLRGALAGVAQRYERRRLAGEHDGPPLRAVRAYKQVWRIDPSVKGIKPPDENQLLVEYAIR